LAAKIFDAIPAVNVQMRNGIKKPAFYSFLQKGKIFLPDCSYVATGKISGAFIVGGNGITCQVMDCTQHIIKRILLYDSLYFLFVSSPVTYFNTGLYLKPLRPEFFLRLTDFGNVVVQPVRLSRSGRTKFKMSSEADFFQILFQCPVTIVYNLYPVGIR